MKTYYSNGKEISKGEAAKISANNAKLHKQAVNGNIAALMGIEFIVVIDKQLKPIKKAVKSGAKL